MSLSYLQECAAITRFPWGDPATRRAASALVLSNRSVSDYYFFHRAAAARRAICLRRLTPSFLARAFPPLLPSCTAALFLPSPAELDSSISPVAIFMTCTAFETTSAGRL